MSANIILSFGAFWLISFTQFVFLTMPFVLSYGLGQIELESAVLSFAA